MTQPQQQPTVTAPTIMEPTYPMVVHMISNPMFPVEPGAKEEPIHWVISKPHPFVPQFKVMRMFIRRGFASVVEVYSVSEDNRVGMRDAVPMHNVRLAQESMPMDVFVEELDFADAGYPDEDDDPDEPEQDPASALAAPAAQVASNGAA